MKGPHPMSDSNKTPQKIDPKELESVTGGSADIGGWNNGGSNGGVGIQQWNGGSSGAQQGNSGGSGAQQGGGSDPRNPQQG